MNSRRIDGRAVAWLCFVIMAMGALPNGACAEGPPPTTGSLAGDFAHPPLQWKSRPLWFWNVKPSEVLTSEIMEQSLASGYAGFGILPFEKTALPFMGPEYLEQYRHAVKTATRLGQKMCIYDEYWFPSGSAGELLRQKYPEALSKRLEHVETEVVGPATVTFDVPAGDLMAAVAVNNSTWERVDITGAVTHGKLTWEAPDGSWSAMAFVCVPDGSRNLVDYLDPAAVRKFASLTYEGYHAAFPEDFGRTVDSAFYDEPTFHWTGNGRAWTPDFNRKFEVAFQQSPRLLYPALWRDIGPDTASARNQLFGFRARLFAEGFVRTLAEWCAGKGIELTGHQDQEEAVNPVCLSGDMIKCFQYQSAPGVDEIFKYGRGSNVFKIVSSAAVNYGHSRVMSETYGAMTGMPVAVLYKEAMDQFAKGINVLVPHAVWSDAEHIQFPPELSWRTPPYAAELPRFNNYVGRCQRILQQGRPVVDIAVLYPIHDLQAATYFDGPWSAYNGMITPPWSDYQDVGARLSHELRQDFTFLHPETLDARCTAENGTLHLGHPRIYQDYRVLVLPGMQVTSAANLSSVKSFWEHGGQVIATTCLPARSAENGCDEQVRTLIGDIFGTEAVAAIGRVPRYPSVRASSVPGGFNPADTPGCAVDGHIKSAWSPQTGATDEEWLAVDFGQRCTVTQVRIREDQANTAKHRVECWDGQTWRVRAQGNGIGDVKDYDLGPVETAQVRLVVVGVSGKSPRITEFLVMDASGHNLARLPQISEKNNLRTVNRNSSGGCAWFIEQPSTDTLAEVLAIACPVPDVKWSGRPQCSGGTLTYLHKEIDTRQFYFFANSADDQVTTTVTLRGAMRLERWDPHTGGIAAQPASVGGGTTSVTLELPPVASVFLVGR